MEKRFELVAKTQKMNEQVKELMDMCVAKVAEDEGSKIFDQLDPGTILLYQSMMALLNQTCDLMEEQAKILEEIYKNTNKKEEK